MFKKYHDAIEIVILDLIMPNADGKETLQKIMKFDSGARILLASGYSQNGIAEKLLQQGAKGFLQKPFRLQQISEQVHRLL